MKVAIRLPARFVQAGAATSGQSELGAALSWPPDSGKFRLLAGILLALFAAYEIAYLAIAVVAGWPHGFGDSFALWSWGRFLQDHPATTIYDAATVRAAQLALGMDPGASYPFAYPPSYLPVLSLLGLLPGPVAFGALIAVSLPFYLWATVGREWRSPALIAALVAPTTAIAMVSGQSGLLAAALLAGGLRLAAGSRVAAGIFFGLLTYKPQFGLLVPVALLAAGLWRTLAAAVVTAIVLVLLTSLLFGGAIWPSWVAALPAFSRQFAAESSQIVHFMPTILIALLRLGAPPAAAQLAQWAATFGAMAIVWTIFRSGPTELAGAGLLVAAPLATPYAFVYDLPGVATAVIWLVLERHRAGDALGTGEVLVTILAMIAPITLVAGTSRFPLATIALILLLGAILRRSRHLRAQASALPLAAPRG